MPCLSTAMSFTLSFILGYTTRQSGGCVDCVVPKTSRWGSVQSSCPKETKPSPPNRLLIYPQFFERGFNPLYFSEGRINEVNLREIFPQLSFFGNYLLRLTVFFGLLLPILLYPSDYKTRYKAALWVKPSFRELKRPPYSGGFFYVSPKNCGSFAGFSSLLEREIKRGLKLGKMSFREELQVTVPRVPREWYEGSRSLRR